MKCVGIKSLQQTKQNKTKQNRLQCNNVLYNDSFRVTVDVPQLSLV